MGKDIERSHKHLVELMLDRQLKKEDVRFSDVSLEDYKKQVRLDRLFHSLKGWTVNTEKLREEIKV